MLRSLDGYILLGLGAAALWILLAVVIGFANMLGSVVSRWRTRVAVTYDKFKMEKKWETPNLARQAAYRLDLADYEKSYSGYDKRQVDIRVCTLHSAEHRCSLAAAESLTAWVREILSELESRDLDGEKEAFVESLLEVLAKGQETLLKQKTAP
jgi:hypothetical protein